MEILKIAEVVRKEILIRPNAVAAELGVSAIMVGKVAKFHGFKIFKLTLNGERHRVWLHPSCRYPLLELQRQLDKGK